MMSKSLTPKDLCKLGAQDAYNRVGMQLFIAGLRPNLRVELMKSNPGTMREAFDAVIDAEKIVSEPKRSGAQISAVENAGEESDAENDAENDADNEEGEESAQINALSAKIKLLKKKAAAKKNKAKQQPNKNANGNNGFITQKQRADGKTKVGACRYCKKEGHFQAECFSRKNANAPMVDAQGNPFRSGGGGVHSLQSAFAQQQLQQQQQQQQFNPYAHCVQNEQNNGGGGVGAIWSGAASEYHLNY